MNSPAPIDAERFYDERDHRTNLTYRQPSAAVPLAIGIADSWAETDAGQLAFLWLSSLISRMGRRYNRLRLILSLRAAEQPCRAAGAGGLRFGDAVIDHLRSADPYGAYSVEPQAAQESPVMVVGAAPSGHLAAWSVRPSGWSAGLLNPGTTPAALPLDYECSNPIGAALAAAVGAAAVYDYYNGRLVPRYGSQPPVWLSTFGGGLVESAVDPSRSVAGPSLPDGLDFGKLLVIGAGALGGNALGILREVRGLRGRVDVVDNDTLDLSNLNRLVIALATQLGMYKAELAAGLFFRSHVEALAHTKQYEDLACRAGRHLAIEAYDAVLSGVDQMASRAFVQSCWPRLLIDGGTRGFSWRVSQFPIGTIGACAGCLAGNAQGSYAQLKAALACAGGVADPVPPVTAAKLESYGFVSFMCAAFMAAAVLQRTLGLIPVPDASTSVEADALYLAGMRQTNLAKSELCLCRCGQRSGADYRKAKYARL